MTKSEIPVAIRQIAAANGERAPGSTRVATETGRRKVDCYPKYWARWGDAVREAGLQPNALTVATPEADLITDCIGAAMRSGLIPTEFPEVSDVITHVWATAPVGLEDEHVLWVAERGSGSRDLGSFRPVLDAV